MINNIMKKTMFLVTYMSSRIEDDVKKAERPFLLHHIKEKQCSISTPIALDNKTYENLCHREQF